MLGMSVRLLILSIDTGIIAHHGSNTKGFPVVNMSAQIIRTTRINKILGDSRTMKQALMHRRIQVLMLSAIVFTTASMASAQIYARRVANEPFSGRVVILNRMKGPIPSLGRKRIGAVSVTLPIERAWQAARPVLTDVLLRAANERDIGGGFRTSRNELYLAETGTLYIGVDGQGFTLRYVLAGNNLKTSLRVPFQTPSDPRFSVNFDAEVTIDVDRSGSGGIVAGPARVKLNVSRPTGANLTGDLVVASNSLVKFLSGKDFIGEGVSTLNSQRFALSTPVNFELDRMFTGLTSRNTLVTPIMRMNTSGALAGKNELGLIIEDENGGPIVN